MSKLKSLLILAVLAAVSSPAMADKGFVKEVPAGAVAFHFVLDLSFLSGPPELVGYVAFIEGVDRPLFAGPPSKDTAYFTIRVVGGTLTAPIPLPVEPEPRLNIDMLPPGSQFAIYYDESPGPRDWTNADTFSEGVQIAVFEESALLSTGIPDHSFNLFSSSLVDSTPVEFGDQRIDFRKIVPNGVTTTNFGPGRRADYSGSSGGGTAIAIGERRGKGKSKGD